MKLHTNEFLDILKVAAKDIIAKKKAGVTGI